MRGCLRGALPFAVLRRRPQSAHFLGPRFTGPRRSPRDGTRDANPLTRARARHGAAYGCAQLLPSLVARVRHTVSARRGVVSTGYSRGEGVYPKSLGLLCRGPVFALLKHETPPLRGVFVLTKCAVERVVRPCLRLFLVHTQSLFDALRGDTDVRLSAWRDVQVDVNHATPPTRRRSAFERDSKSTSTGASAIAPAGADTHAGDVTAALEDVAPAPAAELVLLPDVPPTGARRFFARLLAGVSVQGAVMQRERTPPRQRRDGDETGDGGHSGRQPSAALDHVAATAGPSPIHRFIPFGISAKADSQSTEGQRMMRYMRITATPRAPPRGCVARPRRPQQPGARSHTPRRARARGPPYRVQACRRA